MLERALDLHRAGDLDAAEPIYRGLVERHPENSEALHLLGVIALQRREPTAALELFDRAIAVRDDVAKYHNNRGNALLAVRRPDDAEAEFRRAVLLDADFAEASFNLGVVLQTQGHLVAARTAYERAIEIRADYSDALNNLGGVLQLQGLVPDAVDRYRRALAVKPDAIEVTANLARALESLNEVDEARTLTNQVLKTGPQHPIGNLIAATLDRRDGRLSLARERLDRLLASTLPPLVEANARHELGQVCDRLGEADAAFAAFRRGNDLRASFPDAKAQRPARFLESIRENAGFFTPARIGRWSAESPAETQPCFFVGFPRSGTTLMEQFLAGHPDLLVTDERSTVRWLRDQLITEYGEAAYPQCLDDPARQDISTWRERYWSKTEEISQIRLGGRLLVDKLTLNIVELGLITRLFPGAPIIVALRDPRDVVLSCFMQKLRPNDAMSHFFTLEGAAGLYTAVMDIWLAQRDAPGLRCFAYRYEDLIASPEATVRTVLDFVGVGWNDAMLEYRERARHRYVNTPSRQAVSEELSDRAIGRWQAYRQYLEPVLPALAPYVEALGYDP